MLARRRQLTTGALFSLVLFLALLLDRPWTSNNELLQEQNQILDLVNITKVANRIVPGVAIPFDDHGSFLGSTIRVVQHSLDSRTDSPSSEGAEDNSQSQIYQDAVSKGHQLPNGLYCHRSHKESREQISNSKPLRKPQSRIREMGLGSCGDQNRGSNLPLTRWTEGASIRTSSLHRSTGLGFGNCTTYQGMEG